MKLSLLLSKIESSLLFVRRGGDLLNARNGEQPRVLLLFAFLVALLTVGDVAEHVGLPTNPKYFTVDITFIVVTSRVVYLVGVCLRRVRTVP